ncbi:molybdenum cofactor biosynthesis protein B [Leucothrix arctica]|uniref:Molybdenum cofactor biosynthesis protein B n=1 Tax=Leucothrix arctica TaxID=1481894 RepID=A0A317C7B7_9GAMM|nr:molybdenum cofactor biosynthesis protein B [Leucothrix arctica]PWQ94121.1 molybdenum cofactor biosynthesis protein B [Leucothrix arctica]
MSKIAEREFIPLNLAILTVSDSRTEADDKSGQTLVSMLEKDGHILSDKQIVKDDRYDLRAIVSQWIADPSVDAIVTTGGTGLTGRDGTPEALTPLFDKTIDGFGEMFRVLSYDLIGTSTLQSRAVAGVANGTFIFCLPGSTGACNDGWSKLISAQLDNRTCPCNLVEIMPRLTET